MHRDYTCGYAFLVFKFIHFVIAFFLQLIFKTAKRRWCQWRSSVHLSWLYWFPSTSQLKVC